MIVSTPITLIDYATLTTDWFGHRFHTGFTWDEKGVRYIIDSWWDVGVRKLIFAEGRIRINQVAVSTLY